MLIQNFHSCQHRLPGMPAIGCDPGCSLTPTETPCEKPTYETCPRYEWVEEYCPACQEAMLGEVQMVRDTVDWTLVCPECGLEISMTALRLCKIKAAVLDMCAPETGMVSG